MWTLSITSFLFFYQNHYHGKDTNSGNCKEIDDSSFHNQETYSGKTRQKSPTTKKKGKLDESEESDNQSEIYQSSVESDENP